VLALPEKADGAPGLPDIVAAMDLVTVGCFALVEHDELSCG
jgi:hypothetical protein